jgi:flagellar protein FliO/FliZ
MDLAVYFRFLLVLALVIGLILGLAWVLKRFGLAGAVRGSIGRKRRLATIESTNLDGRHRVVLIRRDDVEHLVLVGPNTSQVIERGIPAQPEDASPDPALPQRFSAFRQFLPDFQPKDKQP